MSSSRPELRAPREDEAEAVAELLNEHARRLDGAAAVTAAEVRRWWETDVDRETRVRIVPGVGYADLSNFGGRWWVDVRALDERAFEALLDWAEAASQRPFRCFANSVDEPAIAVLQGRGYTVIRTSYRMSAAFGDEPPPAPVWPEGIAVRTLRHGEERAVYETEQAAFADHWEFAPRSFEEWKARRMHEAVFAPELWFVAVAGGELAGIAICSNDPSGDPAESWVNELGVRPEFRRRGIALALLRHAFRQLHARGKRRVTLGVDAENTTGAVALYERAGMHQMRRYDTYEHPA